MFDVGHFFMTILRNESTCKNMCRDKMSEQ